MNGLLRYFQEARAELARVTWPDRAGVIEGTQVVLIFIIALTLIIFALDAAFRFLVALAVPQ